MIGTVNLLLINIHGVARCYSFILNEFIICCIQHIYESIMITYKEYKNKCLEDSNFKKEYDDLEPEYDIINAMIKARKEKGLTQKQLSELTGISQADISRIENGTRNPSLEMIKRLATGMGMRLKLEFIPVSKVED